MLDILVLILTYFGYKYGKYSAKNLETDRSNSKVHKYIKIDNYYVGYPNKIIYTRKKINKNNKVDNSNDNDDNIDEYYYLIENACTFILDGNDKSFYMNDIIIDKYILNKMLDIKIDSSHKIQLKYDNNIGKYILSYANDKIIDNIIEDKYKDINTFIFTLFCIFGSASILMVKFDIINYYDMLKILMITLSPIPGMMLIK